MKVFELGDLDLVIRVINMAGLGSRDTVPLPIDVDGDGCVEWLLYWCPLQKWDERKKRFGCLRIDGTVVWQRTGMLNGTIGSDISPIHAERMVPGGPIECIVAIDIDADGVDEICRLNAATGEVIRTAKWPISSDQAKQGTRQVPQACHFLTTGRLSCDPCKWVVAKDAYKHLHVFDTDLNLQWSFCGNIGHYPAVADIDGDGIDEIQAGSICLRHDGSVAWDACGLINLGDDHVDSVIVGHLRNYSYGPMDVALTSHAGLYLLNHQGQIQWRYTDRNLRHPQGIKAGRLRLDLPGQQIILVDDRWRFPAPGQKPCLVSLVVGSDGRLLTELPHAGVPVYWNGNKEALIFSSQTFTELGPKMSYHAGIYDAHGRQLADWSECIQTIIEEDLGETMDDVVYFLPARVFSTWSEDLVIWTSQHILTLSNSAHRMSREITRIMYF